MAPLYPFIPRDRTYKLSYTSAHDISDSVDSLADTSAAAPFACSLARCHIQSHPHRYPISLSLSLYLAGISLPTNTFPMKATALVEYTASSPQEISLQQGAIVHVLSKVDLRSNARLAHHV